ncbi:MAG: hypothetical protein K6F33_04395, partial [Bacteroidales bacterium]|nr:hypothetical protein [Bacteroidales bacterium]
MKTYRVTSNNDDKTSKSDSFWMNLFYLLVFYKDIFLLVLGSGLVLALIMLLLDFMIPNELKSIDKETTMRLFDELQQTNRHQDAISLMEYKGASVLEDPDNDVVYMHKLSDSYIHTGDYAKAEKMLLDAEKLRQSKQIDEETLEQFPNIYKFIEYTCTRNIYQFYETVGDHKNQLKYYRKYKDLYNDFAKSADNNEMIALIPELSENPEINYNYAILYDSIVATSFDDAGKSITLMNNLMDSVYYNEAYSVSFKLKCLNKLIGWQLDNGHVTDSYISINQAVELIKNSSTLDDYAYIGTLADYCYRIHDVETSKALFDRYNRYLEERYGSEDYDYLSNYVRSFRYLEADNNWEQLIEDLEKYCEGMRRKIASYMPSMTEEQREFYAEKFEAAYQYAFHALTTHPDERLAKICFDNVTFKNGLLLRSNQLIENNIAAIGDSTAYQMYNRLKELRLNKIYMSVSGKKYTDNTDEIVEEINRIEKELALRCTDFKALNDFENVDCYQLQSKLNDNEAIVEMIEYNGNLLALILDNKNEVKHVNIGQLSEIATKLQQNTYELYHDQALTHKIWNGIAENIKDKQTIYYVPVGIFNQLAIGSLYAGNDEYLMDQKDIRLISNPLTINNQHIFALNSQTTNISLWGGINYGAAKDTTADTTDIRAAITRGKSLSRLPFTIHEISQISAMLS